MKSQDLSKSSPSPLNEDKVKIIIRMRPILPQQDEDECVQVADDNTLQIKRPNNRAYMKFSNILPPDSTQKDVFNILEDSIKDFISGTNMTIFAYGQTGAGKTYSIVGLYSPQESHQNLFNFLSSRQRGILSRSLQAIMSYVFKHKQCRISVSFYEIYNEKIFDLYSHTLNALQIRQTKSGQISIPDLVSVEIKNMEDAIKFIMVGLKNRSTRSTHGNNQSSRSHSIFQINLVREKQNNEVVSSNLRIVDLAGSQKFKIPHDMCAGQKQVRVQELTSINGSLSCLGHCISAMIQKSRTHIPFRDSKLTRILSDSFLGKGKMRFIICISPSLSTQTETFSTLQFANRAKKAIIARQNTPTPTKRIKTQHTNKQQILLLTRQIQNERSKIKLLKQSVLKIEKAGKYLQLERQNTKLAKENQQLKKQLNLCTKRVYSPNPVYRNRKSQNNKQSLQIQRNQQTNKDQGTLYKSKLSHKFSRQKSPSINTKSKSHHQSVSHHNSSIQSQQSTINFYRNFLNTSKYQLNNKNNTNSSFRKVTQIGKQNENQAQNIKITKNSNNQPSTQAHNANCRQSAYSKNISHSSNTHALSKYKDKVRKYLG